jgi:hypothetical protein
MNRGFAAGLVLAAMTAVACSPSPLNLGSDPDILWWTDNETGDNSDWYKNLAGLNGQSDAAGSAWNSSGFTWTSNGGQFSIAADPGRARSGRYAIKSSVVSPGTNIQSGACAERDGQLPEEAYYSAWFYVPALPNSTSYWLFFKFRSRRVATDQSTTVEGWDLDAEFANGNLQFELFSHATNQNVPTVGSTAPVVPVARWFQIEAFLKIATDNTGQITFWIDGAKSFDVQNTATVPSTFVEWSVGGIAEVIDPVPALLYVDDAAMSTRRLGPDYPVFTRGN